VGHQGRAGVQAVPPLPEEVDEAGPDLVALHGDARAVRRVRMGSGKDGAGGRTAAGSSRETIAPRGAIPSRPRQPVVARSQIRGSMRATMSSIVRGFRSTPAATAGVVLSVPWTRPPGPRSPPAAPAGDGEASPATRRSVGGSLRRRPAPGSGERTRRRRGRGVARRRRQAGGVAP
jgi:hypothetical protein